MHINLKKEIKVLTSMSLFSLLIILFTDLSIVRTILGLPLVLLLPGYLLSTVLFPNTDDLESLNRIVLSIGLSIIIVPMIGLLLNYFSLGITLLSMMLSITFFNAILTFLSWYRRNKLPVEKRFELAFEVKFTKWSEKSKETKLIHMALVITSLLILITLTFIVISPKNGEDFTEFYITEQNGVASGYPKQLQVGESGAVKAVIINNEHQKISFRIEIKLDGDLIQTIMPISLEHLQKWEETVYFRATKPSDAVKVEFILFKDSNFTSPYRQLKLWVKVLP